MNKGLIGLLCILAFGTVLSQTFTQTVKGQITDEQSGSPIFGATVLIIGSDPPLGAITDVNGYFKIEGVPIGRQSVSVSYLGYESITIPNVLVGAGKEVVINTKLIESLHQLEEVIVTAKDRQPGQPKNELATISAISMGIEEISRFPATFNDPARAALTYAGVQTGGDDLLNEIVIRGNSPKGILWRLEGVEIPNPNHFTSIGSSAGGISMLSNNVLANSDFFTGAFPAQYGNATSGIFDLQLRQGNFEKHEHTAQIGLLGVAAASEGPISRESRASYLFNYRYSTLAMLTQLGLDILGEQEEINFQDLSFKIKLPTKKSGSFSIWGLGGKNSYRFLPDISNGDWENDRENQETGVAGVTNVIYVSEDSFFETIISGSYNQISSRYDSLEALTFEKQNFVESQLRFSTFYNHKISARHTLRIGTILSRLSYDLTNFYWNREREEHVTSLDENDHAGFYQGFGNWQFRTSDQFTLNTGLHFSHFALNGKSYVEPRIGFKWNRGTHVISGGLGLHSRMETVALYTARQYNDDGSFVQNNKDLGFTQAFHTALGFEKMLKPKLRFKAEVYYQHLFNVPIWPNDTTSDYSLLTFSALNTFDGYTPDELANDGTGKNYGLEITLEQFLFNGFYMLTTTSLYKSLYTGADGLQRSTQFDGGYIFNFLAGKEYKVGSNGNNTIGINGKFIFAGGKRQAPINISASIDEGYTVYRFQNNYELKLDGYFRMDFGISYRKNRKRTTSVISLDIQNLTQRENEFFRYYNVGARRIESESQISFFPNLSYKIEF
ncbi:TonB-dependent Receptor Plug Domain [Ekhidna lutea]|uniref:TonB-dependent Receptor Plug Domain n=1 Tax=Ekhidna lutea TaxID=447679 RepID=A0A239FNS5_EKHLU|nr:TonB-dependent receptor [Ekhidna lutea]SNS57883.1 TonB-dependent Receptor Plug Domain [Ekhidna lutea]